MVSEIAEYSATLCATLTERFDDPSLSYTILPGIHLYEQFKQ